uniref:Uncharacterized protein n=1 Tax=Inonotus obliquus TaxID=167356 RepID=A0A5A4U7H3_9AGAM|nr:hypothetical protein [Inonotus obliquus]BBN21283.1 hypothetical protein [Inonotus obliquus]
MKIRQILFAIFILIATALLAVFIYDFLNNLNSDHLVNLNNNNNIVINNQVSIKNSIRDIKNITTEFNVTNDNSTAIFNNEPSSSTVKLIVGLSFGIVGAIFVGFYCFKIFYSSDVGKIESNIELPQITR